MNHLKLKQLADQVTKGNNVERTPNKGLARSRPREIDGRRVIAIEQNPSTNSEWAREARQGKKVVQFKDADTNEYIGVSIDGKVIEY